MCLELLESMVASFRNHGFLKFHGLINFFIFLFYWCFNSSWQVTIWSSASSTKTLQYLNIDLRAIHIFHPLFPILLAPTFSTFRKCPTARWHRLGNLWCERCLLSSTLLHTHLAESNNIACISSTQHFL